MKTFIATISIIALTAVSAFAQEMPADLKMKLEAKALKETNNDASLAKTWIAKQKGAWESIQSMTFPIEANDIKLIKDMAENKYPLDYISQESYISKQAAAAASLPDFRLQIGEASYLAIKKAFEKSGKTNISDLLDILQKALVSKTEIDGLSCDKFRPKTFEIIKKAVAQEYPADFDEQLRTLKEVIEGKKAEEIAADTMIQGMENEPQREITETERKKLAIELFNTQTYMTNTEHSASVLLTEIRGKRVMLVPFDAFTPGTTFSNHFGDQLEYDENEVYSSKEAPFLIIFPKNVNERFVPAKFALSDRYRDLIGTSQYIVGRVKQNIDAYPTRITSINDKIVSSNRRLPTSFTEGSLLLDTATKETLAVYIKASPTPKRVNWLEKSEINRFIILMERTETEGHIAMRVDKLVKWEKYTSEKYYEQKMALERLQKVFEEFVAYLTTKNISDLENSPVFGNQVKDIVLTFKSRMNEPMRERKYKEFMSTLTTLIKTELKKVDRIEFYTGFMNKVDLYTNLINQQLKTIETLNKGQNYKMIIQQDLMRNQE